MLRTPESNAGNNKRVALEHPKTSRKANFSERPQSSSISQYSFGRTHYSSPPAQSRDGTQPSRFFPSTPTCNGEVLVPSSSPVSVESFDSRTSQPHRTQTHEASSHPNYFGNLHPARTNITLDPLSVSSGFISHARSSHASLHRQLDESGSLDHDEGPPRKKVNLGSSTDAINILASPPSPEIQRAGKRRYINNVGLDATSMSSDDSLPDHVTLTTSSVKPRLTRTRPSSSQETKATLESPSDRDFISFRMTNPLESPNRIQAAWDQARGDVNKATGLLLDPKWTPGPLNFTSPEKEDLGRVKEIEEASRAQRAAVKEKGKKSMIYAHRTVLETSIPSTPPPRSIIDLTGSSSFIPESPTSPVLKAERRKRPKKLVINSDSESGFDVGNEDEFIKQNHTEAPNYESRALEYLNSSGSEALQELTGCTPEQAQSIIDVRPFTSAEDVRNKLRKKKTGANGISPKMFDECIEMMKGYGLVDRVLENCERIGASLRATISSWNTRNDQAEREDGEISLLSLAPLKSPKGANYLTTQPNLLPKTVLLKEYQLLGINWLNLLYHSRLSCILADEMGLGKTVQVISFFAFLKEQGKGGPHLIVVPSSTLENWCREFARFAPTIRVQTYYAEKNERSFLRETLINTQKSLGMASDGWEVLITTYNLAQGNEHDRKFFRKIQWDCCVYDEGHVLKNFQSQRYQSLLKFGSKWRLLLTGTPLQNNLQELVSLLNFILPDQFAGSMESLRAIFKVKGDTKVTLLSQERISRAKKMMTPFVLRRRKDQVLKDLPKKSERIEWCDMTELQRALYRDTLQRSRKVVIEAKEKDISESNSGKSSMSSKTMSQSQEKTYSENSSNVLMDLRKAASHPMLFRTRFTDDILNGITKQLLKEPDFRKRKAIFDLVKEDMSVMTDSELQVFCSSYKSTRKYLQDQKCYIDAGKVKVLLSLLNRYGEEKRKVLIFSQFTQILDILRAVLTNHDLKFLILTGSTPVDIRQSLVDEFTEDETIPVFLLSTKAGGMGINLTAASVVIMFDQDFNPHNDRQAQDRAYRIGQKRDVEIVKLISRGTIEEDMLRLGETKLALDEAVAGDGDGEQQGNQPERAMKTSLMNVLRQQFEGGKMTWNVDNSNEY